ncbi:MAG: RnfABCDGE type electron transport complex subunit D [Gammaproteobacteria bacterium]|jgi:electron transport complex protein RnfD
MRFSPATPPHLRPAKNVTRVMGDVLLALVPATIAYVWYFGPGLLINIAIAVAVAVAAEAAVLSLRGRPVGPALGDLSVVVAAVLLAFALPPLTPWWVTATAAAFAVVFGKQLFGGIGFNPFNPAMVGYVVVLISFPAYLTQWLPPAGFDLTEARPDLGETLFYTLTGSLPDGLSWDAIGSATPLDQVKTQLGLVRTVEEVRAGALYGVFGARGWEWVNNFIILGGLWLIYRKVIRWQIPAGVLVGLIVPATLFYLIEPGSYPPPTFHVFSGAAVLGAFFIATDPVSAATSDRGRLIFGAGIGLITYVIRTWGGYPDGLAFAVLLMNMAVPTIDHYTIPRAYGHERR